MQVLEGEKALQYLEALRETLTERYNNEYSYDDLIHKNDTNEISYKDVLINRQVARLLEPEKNLLKYQNQGSITPKIAVNDTGFPSIQSLEADLDYIKSQKETISGDELLQSYFDWELDGTLWIGHNDLFKKIEDFNKFLNENNSRMKIQDRNRRLYHAIRTAFSLMEESDKCEKNIITKVNSFYISSFAESNNGEYFLAVSNRKLFFNENKNKKYFLEEIIIEEYRFKHTLLGNNEVGLEKNIIFSYVFFPDIKANYSRLEHTIWTCKKPIEGINHDKRKLTPINMLWKNIKNHLNDIN